MFRNLLLLMLLPLAGASLTFGQNSNTRSASCRFGDGTGLVIRYSTATTSEVPYGSVWTPGGTPFVLLTETPLKVGDTELPIGGYRIYLRPEKNNWSLIVNNGVTISGYDARHNLAQVAMQSGQLAKQKSEFKLSIVRTNPNTCSLTLLYGKNGYWVDFVQRTQGDVLSRK